MIKVIKIPVGKISANCYVVFTTNSSDAIVIDPGDEYLKIENALIENNLYAKAVLITHGHFDHIGALSEFAKYKIPIYIHQLDADKLTTDNNLGNMFRITVKRCNANMLFGGEKFSFSVAGLDILALHTPGHSKGSVCYLIENCLFTGDTLFKNGYGRTDFYDGDFNELKNSLKLKKKFISSDTKILPGHD